MVWLGLHLAHPTNPITLDHYNHPKPPFHPQSVVDPSAFQIFSFSFSFTRAHTRTSNNERRRVLSSVGIFRLHNQFVRGSPRIPDAPQSVAGPLPQKPDDERLRQFVGALDSSGMMMMRMRSHRRSDGRSLGGVGAVVLLHFGGRFLASVSHRQLSEYFRGFESVQKAPRPSFRHNRRFIVQQSRRLRSSGERRRRPN